MTPIEAARIMNKIKCGSVTTHEEHEALTIAEYVLCEYERITASGLWSEDGFRGGGRMNCAYCKYNDQMVYTSNPPKYRCAVTGEYHLALGDCNVEFEPVKHGRWIKLNRTDIHKSDGDWARYVCSNCGSLLNVPFFDGVPANVYYPYCHCGAKMDLDEVCGNEQTV